MSLGDLFCFVMYKWSYNGTLKGTYNKKRRCFSSSFGIYKIFDEIRRYGEITKTEVATKNLVDFVEYSKGMAGNHRTREYLIIQVHMLIRRLK